MVNAVVPPATVLKRHTVWRRLPTKCEKPLLAVDCGLSFCPCRVFVIVPLAVHPKMRGYLSRVLKQRCHIESNGTIAFKNGCDSFFGLSDAERKLFGTHRHFLQLFCQSFARMKNYRGKVLILIGHCYFSLYFQNLLLLSKAKPLYYERLSLCFIRILQALSIFCQKNKKLPPCVATVLLSLPDVC